MVARAPDIIKKRYTTYGNFTIRLAKFMMKISQGERLRIYRKLASLLRNRFSLMDALERLQAIASNDGKDPSDSTAVAMGCWMEALQNGLSFSTALQGWAPQSELLMLSVGDIANLEDALMRLIHVVEGTKRMKEPLFGALGYPMFLMRKHRWH